MKRFLLQTLSQRSLVARPSAAPRMVSFARPNLFFRPEHEVLVFSPLMGMHFRRQMSIMSKYIFPEKQKTNAKAPSTTSPSTSTQKPSPQAKPASSRTIDVTKQKLRGLDENALFSHLTGPLEESPKNAKCLTVALIGSPNVGKSTLMNAIVGEKVSIVSDKAQTTREQTIGVFTIDDTQLIFLDTPGIIPNRLASHIQREIVKTAWETVIEANVVMVLLDLTFPVTTAIKEMFAGLQKLREENQLKKVILVLNKSDKVSSTKKCLENPIVKEIVDQKFFEQIFVISALKKTGVPDLQDYLLLQAPVSEWQYNRNQKVDMSDYQYASEAIREKIYQLAYYEIPYVVRQQNFGWTEMPNGTLRIDQFLLVEKHSQKKILVGEAGKTIKQIALEAKADISKKLNRAVELFLSVKVKKEKQ